MLQINKLTIQNFLSVGNITQQVEFSRSELVLVLGENLDLGGNDNRNGVGKSAIVNALSYALYGTALTNIRKDNLINVSNSKNMLVTLTFDINGKAYTIKRGRRPNIFKFIEAGKETEEEDTLTKVKAADIDESQGEGRNTQEEIVRTIGITHDMFKHILALNTYIEPFLALRTNDQRVLIEQLLGITKLSEKAEKLKEEARITKDEIKAEEFRIAAVAAANKRIETNISGLETKSLTWNSEKTKKINELQTSILEFMAVDIDKEIELHKSKKEVEDLTAEYRALSRELTALEKDVVESTKAVARLDKILSTSVEKICPTCSQEMDKDTHEQVHNEYVTRQKDEKDKLVTKKLKKEEVSTLATSVKAIIPILPDTFYDTIDEAYEHKTTLSNLGNSLESELATANPYVEQIESLRKDGIQEIKFDVMNELVKLKDHQDFLLKLLTNKDSFIRKKIIDQNLTYLNHRLAQYLIDIGLPHTVKFKSDLEVEITMYGKEFDFDNLSRGERTRLILSLSWSFRDVFESMNDKINLLFVDELLDNGLDTSGVESSLVILKKMARDHKRNVFLISHRDELVGRISNVLKVVKEGGFTNIESVENDE
jgi:DNA repair exonuclease SbcCD ATPase subunit